MSTNLPMKQNQAALTSVDSQLLYDVFNASPIGIAVVNLDGQPIFVNPAFCSLLGFSEEELRRKHCVDFSPPEDAQKDWALFQQLGAGSIDHYQIEKRYFRKDGSLIWGRLTISLLNHRPTPLVLGMVDDITEKKTAEEAVRESEERLRLAAEIGKMYAYTWDVASDEVVRSPEFASIFGISSNTRVTRRQFSERVHPDDRAKYIAAVTDLTPSNPNSHLKYRVLRPDGSLIWLEKNSRAFFDSRGRMLRMIGMVADITEPKLGEQELARANERFKLAMEAAGIGGWDFDLSSGENLWFGKAHAQLGMRPDEVSSTEAFRARVHPDDYAALRNALHAAKHDHTDFNHEFRVVWADGTIRWLHSVGRYYYSAAGAAERMLGTSVDITERKQAEEARYRHAAIVESSEDAIASGTLDGIIVSWNAGAEHMYGYTEAEAVGKPISFLVPGELADEEDKILERLRTGGRIEHFETVRLTKTGRRINVSLTISPIKDASGKVIGLSGIARDITQRKLAEERLREYEKAVEGAEEMIAVVDRDYRYLIANRRFLNMRNMTKEEVVGHFVHEVLNNGAFEAAVKEKLDECFEGKIVRYEMKYSYPALGERHVLMSYFPIEGATGIDRAACILQDITDRKRTDEALKESESRFRLVADTAPVMIWMAGPDNVSSYFNKPWLDFTGRSIEDECDHGWEKSIHPDDLQKCLDTYHRAFDRREEFRMEYRLRRHDGEYRWILDRGIPRFNQDDSFAGYIGSCIDVSERKRAEEALGDSEERLRLAQSAARIGTFEWNIQTGVNTWTTELESMYGLQAGEFCGTQTAFENLVYPDDRAEIIKLVGESLKTGQPTNGEWRVVWPDQSVHWIAGRWQVFMDESGRPSRMVGVNIDVTDRKRAEEALLGVNRRLIEAQEQERIRVARELHDDVAQRLAMLTIKLEQLEHNPYEIRSRLQELRYKATEIANDVQSLSHELHSSKLEYLGAIAAIRGWCKEFSDRQGVEVSFRSDVSNPLPLEIGLCLFRVAQEALHNALKHSGVTQIKVQLAQRSNEVHLTISDSGKGFDVETAMLGQGLGLTSMRERIRLVNGTIAIQSKPMGGTTIHVCVPVRSEQEGQRAAG